MNYRKKLLRKGLQPYDNFISSLNATKMDELNCDNVKGLLIEEYKKREEK